MTLNLINKHIIMVVLLFISRIAAAQTPIVLEDGSFESIEIHKYAVLHETDETEAESLITYNGFLEAKDGKRNIFSEKYIWLKFLVDNRSGKDLESVLMHNFALTNDIRIYKVTDGKPNLIEKTGNNFGYGTRKIQFRKPSVPLVFQPGLNVYLARIQPNGLGSIYFQLMPSHEFLKYSNKDTAMTFLTCGVILFSFIYNFFVFVRLRYPYYIHYIFYSLTIFICYASFNGLIQQYVLTTIGNAGFFSFVVVFFGGVSIVFSSLFCMEFLKTKGMKSHNFLRFNLYASILVSVLAVIEFLLLKDVPYTGPLVTLLSETSTCIMIVVGSMRLFQGDKPALYFIIAWIAFAILSILSNIIIIGAMDWKDTSDIWGLFGIAVEVSLLSLALGHRVKEDSDHLNRQIEISHGELEVANKKLEENVRNLDRMVAEKTSKISYIMNNVNIGIFKFGIDRKIDSEYSKACLDIFDSKDISGLNVDDLLFQREGGGVTEAAHKAISALEVILGEPDFTLEANQLCLSNEIIVGSKDKPKTVALDWSPIKDEGIITGFLISARDVTYVRELENIDKQRIEVVTFLVNVIKSGREKMLAYILAELEFIKRTRKLSMALVMNHDDVFGTNLSHCLKKLHTIKGNARTFGLDDVSRAIHETETAVKNLDNVSEIAKTINQTLMELETIFNRCLATIDFYLNTSGSGRDKVNVVGYINALEKLMPELSVAKQRDAGIILDYLKSQADSSLNAILAPAVQHLQGIASRIGKSCPHVLMDAESIYIKPEFSHQIYSALVHLFRNSLDHGIETNDQRILSAKPLNGTIRVTAGEAGKKVRIVFEDDGQGLQIRKIYEKAKLKGLLSESANPSIKDVANLIFLSGFSSKNDVTEISGRGVGLDAVKEILSEIHGSIDVEFLDPKLDFMTFSDFNEEFAKFRLVIALPLSLLIEPDLEWTRLSGAKAV